MSKPRDFNFPKMQEKVVFKLEALDKRIKQKAMKIVCEFSGVTVIDVKEQGKLKVTGEFDKFVMTKKLKKICDSVDIIAIGPDGKPEENNKPVKKPQPKVTKPPTKPPTKPRPEIRQSHKSNDCIIL